MTNKIIQTAGTTGLIACAAFFSALTGYATEGSKQPGGDRDRPAEREQSIVVVQDDYDYFPSYETYYNRNSHEYYYRDGDAWVSRPAPRGVTAEVLLGLPSVRMDFHDTPDRHHSSVVRSYPKDWKRPNKAHDDKDDRRDDKKNDRKDEDRKDKNAA